MERIEKLRKTLSKKILRVFSEGLKDDEYFSEEEKQISYAEAIDVLEYTISEVKKKPILF